MKVTEIVAKLAEPVVKAHGCELWDVEYVREGDQRFLRIFLDKETGIYNLCLQLCSDAGFAPRIKYIGRRPENLLEMVASGRGIALLMHRHTDYLSSSSTVAIPLDPPVELPVCVAKPKGREPSGWAKTFLEELAIK